MSNQFAIAAVTSTLFNLVFLGIRDELGSGNITALPLDKARSGRDGNQVNLFLYHTMPNAAFQNDYSPSRGKHSHTGKPPLALDLFYLITVYGQSDSETKSHRLLGQIMNVLHDHPILHSEEIELATGVDLADSNLHRQVEQINITSESLSFETMSQIWRGFQAQYRASVAYRVSAVLIDSSLPATTALPVLARNDGERGAIVFPKPLPVLHEVKLPYRQVGAQPGDVVTLLGKYLDENGLTIQARNTRAGTVVQLDLIEPATASEVKVHLPTATDSGGEWHGRAGFYSIYGVVQRSEYSWTTNELPLLLAPQVLSVTPREAAVGRVLLSLTCYPQIHSDQQVSLLLGDRGIPLHRLTTPPNPSEPSLLTFQVAATQPGTYVIRLRVDGVDSIPVDFSSTPLQFADHQKIRIVE